MNKILTFLLQLMCLYCYSQGNLSGNVYLQSSNWSPVEGIKINASSSNGDYSKADGYFNLLFPQLNPGSIVSPQIGENNVAIDKNGKSFELVNENELKYIPIPENPDQMPLKIIVCPEGARNIAARKYYRIMKNETEAQLEKIRKELIDYKNKLGIAHDLVKEKQEELNKYIHLNDSVKIFKDALMFASINRDSAKKRANNYLDALNSGVSIEKARAELSTEKAYHEALNGIENIHSSVEEIRLNARSLKSQLKFDEALSQYDTIYKILSNKLINPLLSVEHLISAGNLAFEIHRYTKALKYKETAYDILKQSYSEDDAIFIPILYEISLIYVCLDKDEIAKKKLVKALDIYQNTDKRKYSRNIGMAYNLLTTINLKEKSYQEAEQTCLKAIEVLGQINNTSYNIIKALAFSYNRLALINFFNNNDSQIETYYLKAISLIKDYKAISNENSESLDESLAQNYIELATLYYINILDDNEKALNPILNSNEIFQTLAKKNPEKYSLQYAESLQIMLSIICRQLSLYEYPKEYETFFIKNALTMIKEVEKISLAYLASNPRVKKLSQKNSDFKLYFSPLSENPIPTSYFNDPEFAVSYLERFYKDTDSMSNPKEKLAKNLKKLGLVNKIYLDNPQNLNIKNSLRVVHLNISVLALESGDYDLAILSAHEASELDATGNTKGFENLILVNAYVLKNKPKKAWIIYRLLKDELFPGTNNTYKSYFLADIEALESKGIHHKEFTKIKKFLND